MTTRRRPPVTLLDGPHAGTRQYGVSAGLGQEFTSSAASPGRPGHRDVHLYRLVSFTDARWVRLLRTEPISVYAPSPPGPLG